MACTHIHTLQVELPFLSGRRPTLPKQKPLQMDVLQEQSQNIPPFPPVCSSFPVPGCSSHLGSWRSSGVWRSEGSSGHPSAPGHFPLPRQSLLRCTPHQPRGAHTGARLLLVPREPLQPKELLMHQIHSGYGRGCSQAADSPCVPLLCDKGCC